MNSDLKFDTIPIEYIINKRIKNKIIFPVVKSLIYCRLNR
jgi:hypothetical protein